MCVPIAIAAGISATTQALAGLAIVSAATSVYAGNKQASAQSKAINQQNEARAQEIAVQKGKELSVNAQRAASERAAMRAGAAESGINLGSGSFMAALQTSEINESNESGTIFYNEQVQQRARRAEAGSAMSSVQKTTGFGAALKIGGAAAQVVVARKGK